MREGSRKLWAFIATQVGLLGLGGMTVAWGGEAQVGPTLTALGGTMSMTLLYFCCGNAAEHAAKRGQPAKPGPVPTPPAGALIREDGAP